MTINDYIKNFNGAKKNFLVKNKPQDPKQKNPYTYLENITVDDVIFEPKEALIYKTRQTYTASARYSTTVGNTTSSGSTDYFADTTKDIYLIRSNHGYYIPDEVKKIYNVSTTYKFYNENDIYTAILDDAKPKLATMFKNSGAKYCYSDDVYPNIKSYSPTIKNETFREMNWSHIYLKNRKGEKGKCIGISYLKEGRHLYLFYKNAGKPSKANKNSGKSFNFGKLFVAALVTTLVAFIGLTTFAQGWQKFKVTTCASGFSINRNPNWSYSIEDLNIKQKSNSFYLEDYFVSEEYGTEYTVKGALFPIGKVKLAKKSEYYNQEKFNFNVANYHNKVLTITSDMNYVKIYSNTDNTYSTYIRIEKRTTPIDITFENVKLTSSPGVPVICSAGICDVNIIAKGNNIIKAGKQTFTVDDLKNMLKSQITDPIMRSYYNDLTYIYNEIEYWNNGNDKTFSELYEHYGLQLANSLLSFTEGAFNFIVDGATTVIAGRKGEQGAMGANSMIILGGLSVKCEGTLKIVGGDGGDGLPAGNSILGNADGGDGGNGGDGICCTSYITADNYDEETLIIEGGNGGSGGEPSKGGLGLLGSNGKRGKSGSKGIGLNLPTK